MSRGSGVSDERIDAVVCAIGRRCLRVNRRQFKALELIAYLSRTLRLVDTGQSSAEYAVRLVIEVDGERRVEIDTDGEVELLDGK
jgi:hypothetical protein